MSPITMLCDLDSCCTFSRTSLRWPIPASGPIRTSLMDGSPMVVVCKRLPRAICTSSTLSAGTMMRRMAVHFWPALVVISRTTSFIKISNSAMPGCTSGPRIQQLSESASILKGTDSDKIRGCDLSMRPVDAEPVNVTTSSVSILSSMPRAEPQINCNEPAGKISDLMISSKTASVR